MTALDAFASEPRWVAWRNELRGQQTDEGSLCARRSKAKAR